MSARLNILVVAPAAPPRNGPEAIQVRRILAQLDQQANGTLVTVVPDAHGWSQRDESLALPLQHFDTVQLRLPLHRFTHRVFSSHRLKRLHVPDAWVWIAGKAGAVVRQLKQRPDIIYSRSSPMSGALLALKLKQKLGVAWVMHLSDPWADSPYRTPNAHDARYEAMCFAQADLVTLTTQGQVAFYQQKYPQFAQKIVVSSNVMPEPTPSPAAASGDTLQLVFAGNLYAARSFAPLLQALKFLESTTLSKLQIDVYGHAQPAALDELRNAPHIVHYHGPVSFAQAVAAQQRADVVLSIEPAIEHPLGRHFLPSKVMDCLALMKPIFAITPEGSETEAICREGYGWAASPLAPETIAAQLSAFTRMLPQLRSSPPKAPPVRYSAQAVVTNLLMHMDQLRRR